jgi:purine-nucleoside phosphorylase
MYKTFTKKDWHKILQFPTDKNVDALIVSGNSIGNRDREERLFKESISKYLKVKKVNNIKDKFFSSIQEYEIEDKLIWFDVAYGGAYLSELIHIACTFGSKKNFLIGSCGGLQKNLDTGDIIIPTYSYGNESTTRMYQRDVEDNRHYTDKNLNEEIINEFKEYDIHRGPVITCQAMLAETQDDVDNWERDGFLGVEMESSTFIATSNHFKTPNTVILHVSDNLVKKELYGSEKIESKREFRNNLKKYKYKVILENILKK